MVQKTVLVTGTTRGIGLKFVEHYVKLGWNVIAAARNPATADKLKALSLYKIVQLDTSDETSILSAAKELGDEAIDLLINNAGIYIGSGTLASTTKDDLLKQFEANTVRPFLVTGAFILQLNAAVAKHGSANVVQISSSCAQLDQLELTIDLKKDKICAFMMCPGWVQTDMNNGSGAITTDTSVNGLVSVIDKFTLQDTGKFYNYARKTYPW